MNNDHLIKSFDPREAITDAAHARAIAERLVSAAGLSERVELREESLPPRLSIGGPDGFGFFGTTSFRWVHLPLPTTPRALALAVARHILGEYWATDEEIALEHARLPLALVMAL